MRVTPIGQVLLITGVAFLREASWFCDAFQVPNQITKAASPVTWSKLFLTNEPEPEKSGNDDRPSSSGEPTRTLLDRFSSPIIDDPWLPISDVSAAQIVAPALQVFWISLVHAPSPTWLRPLSDNILWQARGSLLAPTLIHGAALACCWLTGALAAEAYSRKAIDPTVNGYGAVIGSVLRAGAFATGILVLSTQIDLLLEYGRYVQPGESEEIDLRLLCALVEVLNDVIFEASTIASLRLLLAVSTDFNSRRRK